MIPFWWACWQRVTNRYEQVQPPLRRQALPVTVVGDGHAFDQLHDEVGAPAFRCPRVEHAGDVGMVHQRQGLLLRRKPGDYLASVHARLDDL